MESFPQHQIISSAVLYLLYSCWCTNVEHEKYTCLTHKILPCLSFLTVLWSEKEFHDAAKRNDTGRMQELIKKGVDVKAKNKVSLLLDRNMDTFLILGSLL